MLVVILLWTTSVLLMATALILNFYLRGTERERKEIIVLVAVICFIFSIVKGLMIS